jgi:hypothetical protein
MAKGDGIGGGGVADTPLISAKPPRARVLLRKSAGAEASGGREGVGHSLLASTLAKDAVAFRVADTSLLAARSPPFMD